MPKAATPLHVQKPNLIERLFDPSNSLHVFMFALAIAYCVVPLALSIVVVDDVAFVQLAAITALALAAMWLGSRLSIFDYRFKNSSPRLTIRPKTFVTITWLIFILFVIVTFATASSIPFLSALSGVDANQVSAERGAFLKGREGAGIALLYLSTIFVNTIVPYSVALFYSEKLPGRHLAAVAFLIYSVSFMQKALFLNLVLPMLVLLASANRLRGRALYCLLGGAVILLVAVTALSMHGWPGSVTSSGDYFSALYIPSHSLDYVAWRAVAVPIFTASDSLIVHQEGFHAEFLMGATSSLVAALTGVERINFERHVFEFQFGGWNDTANSNAVFVVDAFVNFGWFGVFAFGFVVGQIFRWFRISRDIAFRSLWPLFGFGLFSGALIGMLLSNGWGGMLFHALFIRVRGGEAPKWARAELKTLH